MCGRLRLRHLLHQRGVSEELVFHLGHQDFRIREDLRVGLLHPQARDVIGMKVRDHHCRDRCGIKTRRLHVVGELAHCSRPRYRRILVEQHDLAAGSDRGGGEGIVELVRPDATRRPVPS